MDDYFKKAADRLPKNVYIVYTDGLVDSLRAADMLKTICQSSTNLSLTAIRCLHTQFCQVSHGHPMFVSHGHPHAEVRAHPVSLEILAAATLVSPAGHCR